MLNKKLHKQILIYKEKKIFNSLPPFRCIELKIKSEEIELKNNERR